MNSSLSLKKGSRAILEVNIPFSEFEPYLKKAKENLKNKIEIEGFRRGKVPENILLEKVGEKGILNEAADIAIKDVYNSEVKKRKLEPIGEPLARIKRLEEGGIFSFEVEFFIIPRINLPDYRELAKKAKREKVSVSEKEVEDTLEWLRKSRAQLTPIEREAKEGDMVEVEYSSPEIEGGRLFQDRFILGKGGFVKGFEDAIKQMEKGEKKKVEINFPQDYFKENLAGKRINMDITLKGVFEAKLPNLSDEFAKSLGNFQDLKSLKESIKEGIKVEKEEQEKRVLVEGLLSSITKEVEVDIPEILLNLEKERVLRNIKESIDRDLKISFDEYLKRINKSQEEFQKYLSQIAKENIKKWLTIREIARLEKITISDEEIEEKVNETLKSYPDINKVKREIDLERLRNYTKEEIRNQKVFSFLLKLIPDGADSNSH